VKNDEDKAMYQEREPFTVGSFRPDDADGIVDLFRAVYGEGYPIRLFYDPAAITAANTEGRYYSICARTASGEVIGVTHLYISRRPANPFTRPAWPGPEGIPQLGGQQGPPGFPV